MKFSLAIFTIFALVSLANVVKPQTILTETELKDFLGKAEKATEQYSETFKNLFAEETKTFEDYGKNGELKETRRVKSVFIVYQSPNNKSVGELRNVTEFDGKNVARDEKKIVEFFDKLAKSDTTREELNRIINDGIRFDGRSTAWGMTLWQESPLNLLRPFFDYKIIGREKIENRDVLIVEYHQTKPTLLVKFNPTNEDWRKEPNGRQYFAKISSDFRPANPLINGKIWLDAETAQIWRNEFKIMIQPARLSKPVAALELSYEYQPSEFKVLVPKKFVIATYKISGSSDKDLSVTKDRLMKFEYSKFNEFKTESKQYKINNQ
jgi:hypothetical protein